MIQVVKLPRLNANEDELLISEVLVEVGQRVSVDDPLLVVESVKSTEDVLSDFDGYVRLIHAVVGQMMEVGEPLCLLADSLEEDLPEGHTIPPDDTAENLPEKKKVSAKQRLKEKRALKRGSTKRSSVQEAPKPHGLTPSREIPWVKQMRSALDDRCGSEPLLAERTLVAGDIDNRGGPYTTEGVFIDEGCVLGEGSRIVCRRLYMGRDVKLGKNVLLKADTIYLGPVVRIWDKTSIVSGEVLLEDGVLVADGVSVDLSGGRSEDSRLIAGGHSLIAGGACLNTCREILLERQAALSPGAMVFTHSYWQSVLDGYSATFNGVRVCENAWIGAGCQVLPGVTIGEGSVAISNSTIVEDVPPFTMVGGVPAKTIRSNLKKELSITQKQRILQRLMRAFVEDVRMKRCEVEVSFDYEVLKVSRDDTPAKQIFLVNSANRDRVPKVDNAAYILLDAKLDCPPGCPVFDITTGHFHGEEDPVTHELRNFLRRHGIRFTPYAWDSDFQKGL